MIEVNLNGKTFPLKTLTVQQWQKMSSFDIKQEVYWQKILAIALGVPEKELDGAQKEALELGVLFITHNLEHDSFTPLKIKSLEELTFGDWIDIDIWYQTGIDKNLHLILERLTEDGDKNTTMPAALAALKFISGWRRGVFRTYSGLFNYYDDEDIEELEEDLEEERIDPSRVWYDVLVKLANEDLLQIDRVTELPFRAALNFMVWKKDEIMKQRAELQKQKNKMLI